jgi:hypothetical protein
MKRRTPKQVFNLWRCQLAFWIERKATEWYQHREDTNGGYRDDAALMTYIRLTYFAKWVGGPMFTRVMRKAIEQLKASGDWNAWDE